MHRTDYPRVAARPDPALWREDELLSLGEAVALFWPDGPLSVSSLRTAIRDGRLPVSVVAGKFFVTPLALRALSNCQVLRPAAPEAAEPTRRASDAVRDMVEGMKREAALAPRLPPKGPGSMRRPGRRPRSAAGS
ncbi:hypothetical protein FHR70_003483 [Microvirga lupini]|uniref:Uncharacterized protein n=1 Tax=Microvirga lupini TaxID=420324 RepID=A0A7W4VPB9_9HYPH|nr:hypothetical protein [Microvirga lupini]MBB3020402.1 hypothetical protein [Microvirga lupini]